MSVEQTILPGYQNTEAESISSENQSRPTTKSIDDQNLSILNAKYDNSYLAITDGVGGSAIDLNGTDSLFNPFHIFRYAKYGASDGKSYDYTFHKNMADSIQFLPSGESGAFGSVTSPVQTRNRQKAVIENPSATQIIEFAHNQSDQETNGSTLGPAPYQWNDFLWCKWYGKIPNNRLLTLRRYPIPVEDNLQISDQKMPLVPIAQAVTWWGADTGNSLSSILGIEYGFNWSPRLADVKDVAGNEVEASNLLDAVGFTKGNNETLRQIVLAAVFDNPSNPFASTGGHDKELQDWLKAAYGSEGQYWNRVLGPVNVIDSTLIRERGFKFTHNIELTFSYKLRGFSNINPKIAMLDLISNFLSLTYNTADFWGGATRYFQKTGYIIPGFPTQEFDKGNFIGGITDALKFIGQLIQSKSEEIKKFTEELNQSGLKEGNFDKFAKTLANSKTLQNVAGAWVAKLLQVPLTMRAILDGRAVGEWHLTVGNPMEPLAVIGNLCLQSTTISFSEDLGLDDVPTEVTFKVTLSPGRPRAKQDIESMFNLGGGPLSFSPMPQPSSGYNTYGETNSQRLKETRQDRGAGDNGSNLTGGATSQVGNENTINNTNSADNNSGTTNAPPSQNKSAENLASFFAVNIRKAYGNKFAKSPVLADYFMDLKLKD